MSLISKKICIIGESEVGKNSLICRFVERQFSEKYLETVGVKISQKTILFQGLNPLDKLNIQLLLWNVTGHYKFKHISPKYLRGSSGAIAVADITRPETIERLEEYIQLFLSINPNAFIIVALNKCDLIEQEKLEQLIQLKLHQVSEIYPTSAKTGLYVDEIFFQIAYKILESYGKCSPSHQASLEPEIEDLSNPTVGEDNEPQFPLELDLAHPEMLWYPNLLHFSWDARVCLQTPGMGKYSDETIGLHRQILAQMLHLLHTLDTKGVTPLHTYPTGLPPTTQRQRTNPWQRFYLRTMSCKRYIPSFPDMREFPLAGEPS